LENADLLFRSHANAFALQGSRLVIALLTRKMLCKDQSIHFTKSRLLL
jgi:hypothetical protein